MAIVNSANLNPGVITGNVEQLGGQGADRARRPVQRPVEADQVTVEILQALAHVQ